ncbi:calvin cycle protein CP12-1, chloroplastic-like [Curcuma longa]|uniref:calvin cycle protein CP12-1, chloroplastic-like n=1 Tax=Curcuma longa TaxID=136217 RepID=UPI003D9F5A0B
MATAAAAGVSLSGPIRTVPVAKAELLGRKPVRIGQLLPLQRRAAAGRGRVVVVGSAQSSTPPEISEKVEESIKKAEEACAGDPVSGECAAAWDEVEELSAAASHAREALKANSDPLENYCKDNPETDECRTYDN